MPRRTAFCSAFLLVCALVCVACTDFEVARSSATSVRRNFPDRARLVLERGHGFVHETSGFVRAEQGANLRGKIDLVLPEYGDGALHFRGMNGVEIDVREVDAFGDATREGSAIAYSRVGGSSFWTATPEGFEEWIYLSEDVARGRTAQLVWEVSGAPITQDGPSVVVLDPRGVASLRVTAPVAFDRAGRNVPAEMVVRENRIELFVESNGEEVLVDPGWVAGTSMGTARTYHTATALPNGDVLVVGGYDGTALTSVELWSATSGTWTAKAPLDIGRYFHTATLLPDGRVYVVGGLDAGAATVASTAYFDVGANSWMTGPLLMTPRQSHTMNMLADGRLLAVGGVQTPGFTLLDSVELFAGGTWTAQAPMSAPRLSHTATLLDDGRVLVAGSSSIPAQDTYEIYDPATNAWSAPKNLLMARTEQTAVPLNNGNVLLAGGENGNPSNWADLYEPTTDTWTALGSLQTARYWHTATLLPNGAVFVVGGFLETNTTEFIKPNVALDTWFTGPSLALARFAHTTTLLNDGRLLVAGGTYANSTLSSVEILQTNLKTGLACSSAIECATGFCADGVCCDKACDGGCGVCSIAAGAMQDGACTVVNGTCDSSVTCHIGICAPMTGDCLDVPAPDNTPCEGAINGMPAPGVCLAATCYVDETGEGGTGGSGGSGGAGGTSTSSSGAAGMGGGTGGDGGTGSDSTASSTGTSGNGSGGNDNDTSSCRCSAVRKTTGTGMWAALLPLLLAGIRRSSSSRYLVKGASKP